MSNGEIPRGDKIIKVDIHFFTNKLPEGSDLKTAWAKGVFYLEVNKPRGIKNDLIHFNGEKEFLPQLRVLLAKNGITLLDIDDPHNPTSL